MKIRAKESISQKLAPKNRERSNGSQRNNCGDYSDALQILAEIIATDIYKKQQESRGH